MEAGIDRYREGEFLSVSVDCYVVGKPSDKRDCSKKWHIQPEMEILWSKRGYFGPLRNIHILVYYPILSYQKIKF